jgi:hypothetical protein
VGWVEGIWVHRHRYWISFSRFLEGDTTGGNRRCGRREGETMTRRTSACMLSDYCSYACLLEEMTLTEILR